MRSRLCTRSKTRVAAGLLTVLMATALPLGASEPRVIPELAGFEPFLGKTWKGLVNAERGLYDVSRWEAALSGRAVRIVHSVGDGFYGGETVVMWDASRKRLVYYYFTTAGFYTQGMARFEDGDRLVSLESVAGDAGGVTEVESTQELLAGGRLRVATRMLRNGVWEKRPEILYRLDLSAEVVLPKTLTPTGD